MNHGSLFSGIGGFDLAAEWMGWNNIFHCEWNEFCQKVLKYYWPKAISYEDIKTTDFTRHRGEVDILTGGAPCQPYSSAGKRKGTDDPRHLWPEMYRAILEAAPAFVVFENVTGILTWNRGMVFEDICLDLEDAGYQVTPFVIPAASTGAPHLRNRVFIVAYASGNGQQSGKSKKDRQAKTKGQGQRDQRERVRTDLGRVIQQRLFTDSDEPRHENGQVVERSVRESDKRGEKSTSNKSKVKKHGGLTTNSVSKRGIQSLSSRSSEQSDQDGKNIKTYANTYSKGLEGGRQGTKQARWGKLRNIHREGSWDGFPTESPVCRGDDELSKQLDGITFPKWRSESIKGYGNAIVPQVALQIFKSIEEYETNITI